jgi:hypothetical protein
MDALEQGSGKAALIEEAQARIPPLLLQPIPRGILSQAFNINPIRLSFSYHRSLMQEAL